MIPTFRTFWIITMMAIFLIGQSGCGEKRLEVSTSSGKTEQPEGLQASGPGTETEQSGIHDSSLSESGLGNQSEPSGSSGEESGTVALMPSSSDQDLEDSGSGSPFHSPEGAPRDNASQTAQGLTATEPRTGDQDQSTSDSAMNPPQEESTSDSAMNPLSEQVESTSELPEVPEEAPLVALGNSETDEAPEAGGSSLEEEIAALAQSTQDQPGVTETPHVERIPDNIAIAKTEPSGAVEEQLARIKEEELATKAAGLQDVFFEFDSWRITEDGKDVLEKSANWLQEDSANQLVIEGHCDQRGTQAYNIVLGKKRALAIRDYLVQLGIESSRLEVITFGKEKPFCADSTEVCHQLNRRGHLLVKKQ